jgi:L-lactate utilization protein LutB
MKSLMHNSFPDALPSWNTTPAMHFRKLNKTVRKHSIPGPGCTAYGTFTGRSNDASQCRHCGVGKSLCPCQILVRQHLKEETALFGH